MQSSLNHPGRQEKKAIGWTFLLLNLQICQGNSVAGRVTEKAADGEFRLTRRRRHSIDDWPSNDVEFFFLWERHLVAAVAISEGWLPR